jgi:hypothetical protein
LMEIKILYIVDTHRTLGSNGWLIGVCGQARR